MDSQESPTGRAIALYLIINVLLTLSVALPAAALTNHLLGRVGFSNARLALLLAAFGALGLLLTLPLLPRLRRHIAQGDQQRAERRKGRERGQGPGSRG